MFLVRQSTAADVGTLVKLARMVYFINLPPVEGILAAKIAHSARCFAKAGGGEAAPVRAPRRGRSRGTAGYVQTEDESDFFMFTMEDLETGGVIGTSQVRAHMGGAGNPNWSMMVTEKSFRSDPLGFGTTHKVARLYGDETGPSEIGGLILQPSHRGHPARPGRFLSFVRFHFMALHRAMFADRVIAEMMGPVTGDGDSLFWDHFGRKFIPVRFAEADRFCQHNRKFISELLPKEEIYLTLFPLEVQNQIGVVARETIPARRLLESLGFKFRNFIDPFDGGPHLDAPIDEIPPVRDTRVVGVKGALAREKCTSHGIVSTLTPEGEFRAIETPCEATGRSVRVPHDVLERLAPDGGGVCGFTPLPATSEATASIDQPKGRRVPRGKVRA